MAGEKFAGNGYRLVGAFDSRRYPAEEKRKREKEEGEEKKWSEKRGKGGKRMGST